MQRKPQPKPSIGVDAHIAPSRPTIAGLVYPLRHQSARADAGIRPYKRCISRIRGGIALLFLTLLLCGCAQNAAPHQTVAQESTAMATSPASGLYDAGSRLEQQTNGAVRTYPLDITDARDLWAFDGGILVFSGEETTLTLLTGENLAVSARLQLGFPLSAQDPSVQSHGDALSYFDSVSRETVVLDNSLTPVTRIAAPPGLSGTPVLSEDRNTLYYCTSRGLFAWDLESGIHRTVKEMAYPGQSVVGLAAEDTVIRCITEDGNLFIAANTGRLVKEWNSGIQIQSLGNSFFASFPLGFETALVFGTEADARILLPEQPGDAFFLPRNQALVCAFQPGENALRLDYYSLESGRRLSQLNLETGVFPHAITGSNGYVYLLTEDPGCDYDVIYRWDPAKMPINETVDYTAVYLTDPQETDLAQCQAYAQAISAKYGIEILIGKAAVKAQPWDFHLEAETQSAILLRELQLLEQRLKDYPPSVLADTAGDFSSLKLCLVRSATGSAASGSIGSATGVQFLEGSDAYVAIVCGRFSQQALYHELFHAMQTHIYTYSIAFDQWEKLNPSGFQYDYSYSANAVRDSGIYLQGETRCFIDTYSMSFPKEDRARIFEYAMLPEMEACFESQAMQAKLAALCAGIREAYGLEDEPETFRWEQYLE